MLNARVLRFFGPVLIATGILGFVLPPSLSLMSGAPAYNLFHIFFGALGAALAWRGGNAACARFNIAFGALDLYQLAASFRHWFPWEQIRWTRADDVLHLILGLALVALGLIE